MLTFDKEKLIAEVQSEEGLRLTAYQDQFGVWTVGYGHTGPEVQQGLVWTQDQAKAALLGDIRYAVSRLDSALPWASGLNDARTRALLQMAFQLGIHGLLNFKHMLEALRQGLWDRAYSEAMDSDWARQTPARAQRVAGMLRDG
jgi:lysozyme